MVYAQHLGVGSILSPSLLAVDVLHYLFSQCDGCSAGMVELMHMMGLLHLHVVLWKLVHDLCQVSVYCREYRHSDVSPEQRLSLLAHTLYVVAVVLHPSRRAAHHLHVLLERPEVVTVGSLRSSELYCHVSRCKCLAFKVFLVVNVDDAHYLMTSFAGNLLYHLAHLAVAYQCYLHTYLFI